MGCRGVYYYNAMQADTEDKTENIVFKNNVNDIFAWLSGMPIFRLY